MQINCRQRWQPAATQLKRAGGLLAPVMEEAKLPPCCSRALSSTLSNKVAIIEAKQTPDTCSQQAVARSWTSNKVSIIEGAIRDVHLPVGSRLKLQLDILSTAEEAGEAPTTTTLLAVISLACG
ncbi:hypothetical protein MDA_GLEAN10003154 [Myotis davidii]|uniref:Uncharacterized protein n=1 Tax=Myotis davidii TaxID=225400 RepID=L5MAF5_MYODS|nr:hypothetical protein MDA_GLEAN10003154 [Myotis davidii]